MSRTALVTASLLLAASLASASARADEAEAAVGVATAPSSIAPAPPPPRRERASLLVPGIITGAGLAAVTTGVILVATAPALPPSCDADTKTCARQPGQDAGSFEQDQERAGRAHLLPVAGWMTVGVGGMLVTAGLLTWLFDRDGRHASARASTSTAASRSLAATPYVGAGGCGIVGTF